MCRTTRPPTIMGPSGPQSTRNARDQPSLRLRLAYVRELQTIDHLLNNARDLFGIDV
jgi:hypothetical protein